MSINEMKLI